MGRVAVKLLPVVFVAMFALSGCAQQMAWEERSLRVEAINQNNFDQESSELFDNVDLAKETLAIAEKIFPPDDLRIARSLNNLAKANNNTWNYPEVASLTERALAIIEQATEKNTLLHAKILINRGLANSLWFEGDSALAGSSFKKALEILEALPEHDSIELASALYNLAIFTIIFESDFNRAEPLLKRAIAVKKRVLGPDNLSLAYDMGILAAEYRRLGRFTEAEALYQQALAILEQAYGAGDPRVATYIENVAGDYSYQKEYARAEAYYDQALAILEKNLGADSLDLVPYLEKRAKAYFDWAWLKDSNAFFNRCVEINKKAYGTDDARVGEYLDSIAEFFRRRSYQEHSLQREARALAESYVRQALSVFQLAYGPKDPRVADYLESVAFFYRQRKDFDLADFNFREALSIYEKAYGKDSLQVADYFHSVGFDMHLQDEYELAAEYFVKAFEIRQSEIGADSPGLIKHINDLAEFYYDWKKFDQAEVLYRRALAIGEQVYGKDDPRIVLSLEDVGAVYYARQKYGEAEPYYLRGFEISEKEFGSESVDLVPYLEFMAGFYAYDKWDHARAEQLFRRLIVICERFPEDIDLQLIQGKALWRLILVLNVRGITSEDETILRRAMAVWDRIPDREGYEYQEYAETLDWMASFNLRQGDLEAAEEWYHRALTAWEEVPGHEENFNFPMFLNSLAFFYEKSGREAEGEKLRQRAAEIEAKQDQ